MIGAHAEALDDSLTIDTNELDDARWFDRAGGRRSAVATHPDAPFQPPPRIGHRPHLLEAWVDGLK